MTSEQAPRQRLNNYFVRYCCAFASVALALLLEHALGESVVGISPLFFAAVAITVWYGGLGPGLVATTLAGTASAFFLFEPVFSFRIG